MRQCWMILLPQWGFPATHCCLMAPLADSPYQSDVVDVYNGATGAWSTAQLSVARCGIAAASVGNVALFAGGSVAIGGLLCREGVEDVCCCEGLSVCACCSVAVLFALRPLPLSRALLQVALLSIMLWMCTTVQQGHGGRLSSAWRAMLSQLHLSGTWLCSLGVAQEVGCCAGRGWEDSCCYVRAEFCIARAAVLRFCLPCDLFLSHARHCRWCCCFQCCGCVQRCNRGMVDGSAQRGTLWSCSCICREKFWERGFVRWGLGRRWVVVQGGDGRDSCCYVRAEFCIARAAVLRFCLPCDCFLSHARHLQVFLLVIMLWMCTTVQQGHGRRLSSAWRAVVSKLHLSGTWLCSLRVT
jgi:hypothetical protein